MTTNSFGSPLPRFDFPQQPTPAFTRFYARAAKFFPTVAVVTTAATAYYYVHYYAPKQSAPVPATGYSVAPTIQRNQTPQAQLPRQWAERGPGGMRPSS